MKWKRKTEISEEQVKAYSAELGIDEILARILLNRDITTTMAKTMLDEIYNGILEPSLLTNAEEAAGVIAKFCVNKNAIIFIFADYDADGITSGYVLGDSLREVSKCTVEVYYPERSESYGLSMAFCESILHYKEEGRDVLVITVDNGITKIEEVAYLKENGIEVIITDHHVAKDNVPDCIIVDPHNNGEPDTFKHLAGCGVAFKVAQLVQREFGRYDMMKYTFAVAIGTLADVMPLTLENIAFVQYGLRQMNGSDCPKGIQAFKDYTGKQRLNALDITWELAPRINACGRMGNINLAAELFFDSVADIEDVINAIEKTNDQRKAATKKAQKAMDAANFDDDNFCLFDATGCPAGIVGIIAGKLAEKYGKPAIVIAGSEEAMVGSARGIDGLDLQAMFKAEVNNGNMLEYGGHSVAAGVTINKYKIDELRQSLNQQIEDMPKILDAAASLEEPELIIDALITLRDLNEKMYNIINEIPYDNRSILSPVFALTDVEVVKYKTSHNNPNNICFRLKDDSGKVMDIWGWGATKQYEELGEDIKHGAWIDPSEVKSLHIAGTIDRNFQNKREFTFKIIDLMGV